MLPRATAHTESPSLRPPTTAAQGFFYADFSRTSFCIKEIFMMKKRLFAIALSMGFSVFLVSCGVKVPEANTTNCNGSEFVKIVNSLPQAKKEEFGSACERYYIPPANTASCFGKRYERYMAEMAPEAKKEFAAACAKVKPAKAW